MKKLLIVSLLTAFIAATTTTAFASGYNSPLWSTQATSPDPKMPHGGYADTTNKCKDCHAVHLATGSYKLLRAGATDGQTACSFCHGLGGVVGSKNGIWLNTSGHGLSIAQQSGTLYAPDDTDPGFSIAWNQWGCASCHSVHNNNTVLAVSERALTTANTTNILLKRQPDLNNSGIPAGVTVTLSVWCKECHGANYGTYGQSKSTTAGVAYGHDSGATAGITRQVYAGSTYAYARQNVPGDLTIAPRCNQCHAAGAARRTDVGTQGWVSGQNGQVWLNTVTGEGYFPHAGYSNSYSLLKASSNLNPSASPGNPSKVDDVCNDCHYTPSLP